jgi:hypothetical protein
LLAGDYNFLTLLIAASTSSLWDVSVNSAFAMIQQFDRALLRLFH